MRAVKKEKKAQVEKEKGKWKRRKRMRLVLIVEEIFHVRETAGVVGDLGKSLRWRL